MLCVCYVSITGCLCGLRVCLHVRDVSVCVSIYCVMCVVYVHTSMYCVRVWCVLVCDVYTHVRTVHMCSVRVCVRYVHVCTCTCVCVCTTSCVTGGRVQMRRQEKYRAPGVPGVSTGEISDRGSLWPDVGGSGGECKPSVTPWRTPKPHSTVGPDRESRVTGFFRPLSLRTQEGSAVERGGPHVPERDGTFLRRGEVGGSTFLVLRGCVLS